MVKTELEIGYARDRDMNELAVLLGLQALHEHPGVLQLDLDSEASLAAFSENLELLRDLIPGLIADSEPLITTSPGGNFHAYLKLAQVLAGKDRLLLQTLLGSDPKREMFNLARLMVSPTDHTGMALLETETEHNRVLAYVFGGGKS